MDPEQIAAFIQQQVATAVQQQQPAAMSHRPRPAKPDTFSADTATADVDSWIFQFEEYMEACNVVDNATKLREAATFLRGPASTWWRTVKQGDPTTRPTTWEQFTQLLRHTFKPINSVKVARDKLAELQQKTSVRSYATAFRNIALDIPGMTNEEKLDKFSRGLKRTIREHVEMKEPATFEEAVRLAERYDTLSWQHHRTFDPISSHLMDGPAAMELGAVVDSRTMTTSQSRPHTTANTKTPLTPALRAQLLREGKCFYCREAGHMMINCPKRTQRHPTAHLAAIARAHPTAAIRSGPTVAESARIDGHLTAITPYTGPRLFDDDMNDLGPFDPATMLASDDSTDEIRKPPRTATSRSAGSGTVCSLGDLLLGSHMFGADDEDEDVSDAESVD